MIIHASYSYPPRLGGLEKVVQILAQTQYELGQKVSVITSNQGLKHNSLDSAFPVIRLKSFILANTTIMPGLLLKMLSVKSNDIVHLHVVQAYMPEIVWLASKIKRYQYIAHIHLDTTPSGHAGFLLKYYKMWILKHVLRAAKYVIVFTEDQRMQVSKLYGIDVAAIKVVSNGVEDKFFINYAKRLSQKPQLLFVGRLNYQKNIPQLLHAMNGISDKVRLTLVGEGELRQELLDLCAKLKLKNINFVGRADGNALLKKYKDSDIFVLPSEREGMPLVLLEAMAMGLPIIATDVTGSRDVVAEGKNGLLVPYGNPAAFQAAIIKLAFNQKLYSKLHGNACVMAKQYSWDIIAGHFIKLYGEKS